MALEYALIISGDSTPQAIAARAFANASMQPDYQVSRGGILTADLRSSLGWTFTISPGSSGYFEAEASPELWVWEPQSYLNLGFRFDKQIDREAALRSMLEIVARVLATGPEDAALILNGNQLILLRQAGELIRLPAGGWWDDMEAGDIPGSLRAAQR